MPIPLFSAQAPLLTEAVLRLARTVAEQPVESVRPRTLIVGGAVRDALHGLPSSDIDLEIFGLSAAQLEELIKKLFPQQMRAVGQAFGILTVALGDGYNLDIGLPRRDRKIGSGHRGFLVESDPGLSIEEALRRRDFTCNSLAHDPLTNELIDPFGGARDLEQGILRVTDAAHFPEDPLRIYRALQMAARFDLTTEPVTHALLAAMVERGEQTTISVERVTEEMKKLLLQAQHPSIGFTLARSIGLIAASYPELQALIGTPQEPEWHPEGDVWIHTLMVIDEAARLVRQPVLLSSRSESDPFDKLGINSAEGPLRRDSSARRKASSVGMTKDDQLSVMLGALCHDLGKPETTEVIEGRIRSRGHSEAGIGPTQSLLGRFSFSAALLEQTLHCVREHLQIGALYRSQEKGNLTQEAYANALRRLIKRISPTPWQTLFLVSEADARGRGIPQAKDGPYPPGELCVETIRRYALDTEAQSPLVNGEDLRTIGLVPGPLMGKAIAHIEALRDEGKIRNKQEALDELREWLERP